MEITSATQVVGDFAVADEINCRLADRDFTAFRFVVAFARWSGLHLIDDALQAFVESDEHRVDGLVGVDLGGTTLEALTYLSELPNTRLRVVQSGMRYVVFHPKVYAFLGPERWAAIVGSSNLTTGGIFSNIEAYLLLEGERDEQHVVDGFFDVFDQEPFGRDHVIEVDGRWLQTTGQSLPKFTEPPPDRGLATTDIHALDPDFVPPAPKTRPPSFVGRPDLGTGPTTAITPDTAEDLYIELWNETGGGTQVMIGREVFTEYFGGATDAVTYIGLDTPDGPLGPIRLQTFRNHTFRLGLPFVGAPAKGTKRRGVLRFRRTAQDQYSVQLRIRGERGYKSWLTRCDKQTRADAKRYGFHQT